ncbi:E3 ubiquitin ligase BIG BROTHER-like isoform X1 [Hibiscus syriacus]|uniref:E3 ubiquitin ligase BIG BROTHER-like isoform X1 n=1 Tax=Hibiscus syriacus TaxID=106335 RepID=A0A6A2YKC3_HIBSY|nr:uncharacterized protein LOC120164248 [Hibiscus syriacus]KAE8677484.1 E3 ubiquitin ligase BIG BROTHER-like isoform X1 [Hibiscus syriacus]
MEPAKIDWNRIDSRFTEDYTYEHINAPKWVDFLALDQQSIDDDAWFCTPECNHPRTAQDFLQASPLSKAPQRSVTGGGSRSSPFRELNQGDAKLKRRGQTQTQIQSKIDDSENQNPNLSIPPTNQQAKSLKAAIKSSSERKKQMARVDISQSPSDEIQLLKTTLSTRNLFASRDILSHISEFCNELKKLATRARERKTDERMGEEKIQAEEAVVEKERKPLFDLGQEKSDVMQKEKIKKKNCRSRTQEADAENMAPPLSLNLENVKQKEKEGLLQIRTNPPSPQCFSATKTATPSKAPRSRLMESGILQEVKQNKDIKTGSSVSTSITTNANVTDGRQARALDVFWFLKPCTLSE